MDLTNHPWIMTVFMGFLVWLAGWEGAYKLDYQTYFPPTRKHTLRIPQKYKQFFHFKNRKQRYEFMKIAVIMQLFGYIVLLLSILVAVLGSLMGYHPSPNAWLVIFFIGLGIAASQCFVIVIAQTYYMIRYRKKKTKSSDVMKKDLYIKRYRVACLWNLGKIEKWLAEMEATGYRLEQINFFIIYIFKKCKPRKTNYFFLLDWGKGGPKENMDNWAYMLRCEFLAQSIKGTLFPPLEGYRITMEKGLKLLVEARAAFIQHSLLKSTLAWGGASLFIPLGNYLNGSPPWIMMMFFGECFFLCPFLWKLVSLCLQTWKIHRGTF